jgi:hypothetical protein
LKEASPRQAPAGGSGCMTWRHRDKPLLSIVFAALEKNANLAPSV